MTPGGRKSGTLGGSADHACVSHLQEGTNGQTGTVRD